jgi:hypothetical protein
MSKQYKSMEEVTFWHVDGYTVKHQPASLLDMAEGQPAETYYTWHRDSRAAWAEFRSRPRSGDERVISVTEYLSERSQTLGSGNLPAENSSSSAATSPGQNPGRRPRPTDKAR